MAEDAKNMEVESQEAQTPQQNGGSKDEPSTEEVKEPNFSDLGGENKRGGNVANIDMIMDIPVTVSVELGRTKLLISELLGLGQGSVVELDKLAGEPVEVLVNGKLIARGEVVVVDEKFGIKLTDIVSVTERINRLK